MRTFHRRLAWFAQAVRSASAGAALGGALLLGVPAAAAPTCVDDAGQTVRCEAPAALPVGASPASEAHEDSVPLPSGQTLFGLVCVLGGLFALIGLMPDFDGWDHERRRKGD